MTRPRVVLMTADSVGGVWSYALGLCAALPDIHFVLAILGPPPRPRQRAALADLDNVIPIESGFRLEWMAGGQADIAASCRWLDDLAERHRADLVHINGYAQAQLDGSRPIVIAAHSDVLSWWIAVHGEAAPVIWDRYRAQVVCGLDAAARVTAPTSAVLSDLRRHYGRPLPGAAIIPNGIEVSGFAPLAKRPVIMAAGRVWDEAKNLRLLDEIAPDLSWPIEIAGEPAHPDHGVVRLRHARQLDVLRPAQLRRLLGAAMIFAAPARYEPFGLAILEAAASGCALVLGDIPSLRENWEGAAIFLPPEDAGRWRSALLRLIDDRGQCERLGRSARDRAEHFTLARSAACYRALYLELIGDLAERRAA